MDAEGSGEYAELDPYGRYKIRLPFDLNEAHGGGRGSHWIRMMQPYGGENQGMHFPLHKDTDILLTFIDGDPDRPVIAGAVPNLNYPGPVNRGNRHKSIIKSGKSPVAQPDAESSSTITNNYIEMNDAAPAVVVSSADAWLRMGKNNPTDPPMDPPTMSDPSQYTTPNTDNQPNSQVSLNKNGYHLYTDGRITVQANEGLEKRVVGRGLELARDDVPDSDTQGDHPDIRADMGQFLTTMQNFAPKNVYGYDQKVELEEADVDPPDQKYERFPEDLEIPPDPAPVAEKSSAFKTYFDEARRVVSSSQEYIEEPQQKFSKGSRWDYVEDPGGDYVKHGDGYCKFEKQRYAKNDDGEYEPDANGAYIKITVDKIQYLSETYADADAAFKEYWLYWVSDPVHTDESRASRETDAPQPKYMENDQFPPSKNFADPKVWDTDCKHYWDEWVETRKVDWRKWYTHLATGHFPISHRDTFTFQEGNIYDFGGYWNYNIGGNYVENHMAQPAGLNDPDLEFDKAKYPSKNQLQKDNASGGPNYDVIEELDTHGRDVWVTKTVGGASYDYTTGCDILEVKHKCNTTTYKYGGKTHEYKYNGEGQLMDEKWSHHGVSWETKYDHTMPWYPIHYVYKNKDHFTFEATTPNYPKLKIETKASNFLDTTIAIHASSKLHFQFDADLSFKLSGGAGFNIKVEGKPWTLKFNTQAKKLEFDGPFTSVAKDAKLKAQTQDIVVKKITAMVAEKAGIDASEKDISVRKVALETKIGQIFEGL